MNIACVYCRRLFVPTEFNSRMVGPNIESKCPHCGKDSDRKLNKIAEFTADEFNLLPPLKRANRMIKVAQAVENRVLGDTSKKRRKHGKKGSSNV